MKMKAGDFRVPQDATVKLDKWPTLVDPLYKSKKHYQKLLEAQVAELSDLQHLHYASNRYAVLLIFQAMDAAGKDGAIRHVMSGVNPQGCQVFSFKHPSAMELEHDFLWRTSQCLPERGRIGVITSYSIHYTKLYDDGGQYRQPEGLQKECAVAFFQQIPGTDTAYNEQAGFQAGQPHMQHAGWHGRVENGRGITVHGDYAVFKMHPGRCLHPAIGGHDPECREGSAAGNHHRREQVNTGGYPQPAEQHDAQESRLQHEGHGPFEAEDVADEITGSNGERRPVGAKLEFERA